MNAKLRVDILFMVDNSNSMESMQNELKNRFSQFFQPFTDLAARGTYTDLHIGVVSSDYGAGATGAPGCTPSGLSGGGDQGKLIAIGKKANVNCQKPRGSSFIAYQFTDGGPVSNLPGGQGLVETFTCMASLGANGCGFEHQLESVYAALHNNITDNQGFLRDDALLVVVFLTNEDDASAPPDSDVFDKNKVAQYGYEDSYSRQTRFAVICGDPGGFPPYQDSSGPLASCRPAPNPDGINGPGKQYDVARYRNFFALPRVQGGVKDSPLDVVLIGIDAVEEPFQVILSNPGTPAGQPYVACNQLNEASNPPCVPVLQHSCINTRNPAFFGDPAVRLNDVIKSVKQNFVTSICEDDYTPALDSAARLVVSTLGFACIRDAFPQDSTGKPGIHCNVKEVTLADDGCAMTRIIPACADPVGTATIPCWTIDKKDACAGASPDGVGLSVRRGETHGVPNEPPPRTSAVIECASTTSGI